MTLVVETTSGVVRGLAKGGAHHWRGIPFATAPRWQPPGPAPTWTGERDATRFGPVAVQSRNPQTAMLSGITEKQAMSEDCLVLNVTAPATGGANRPVIVWIHGGAFVMGTPATPLYDGTSFAVTHEVIVVGIQYRLGLLGFLHVDHGNVGLLDQIAALRWVRDNIAAFGGDPGNVTIMGESAGAVSVSTLMAMPAAKGLFHKAISQSGAPPLSPPTRADAEAVAAEVRAELRLDASIDQIVAMQQKLMLRKGLAAFAPYVDGVHLPRPAIERIAGGSADGVPLLVGANRDEWALFAMFLGPAAHAGAVPVIRGFLGNRAAAVEAHYKDDWTQIMGDVAFRLPAGVLADTQRRHAPVFAYRFDYESTAFGGKLGSAHACELPFVWNALDLPVAQILLGAIGDAARALGREMHAAWAAFARTGDPGWPAYDARKATRIFDRTPRTELDPDAELRALWLG